jgi:hypothetical protein
VAGTSKADDPRRSDAHAEGLPPSRPPTFNAPGEDKSTSFCWSR